ncbi:MAG: hypothetical protein AAGG45_10325 [Pseudomonadota bacterium]
MNPLVQTYLKRQTELMQRKQLRNLCRDLREQQRKMEPIRQARAERRKAGIKGEGFVMREGYGG